MTSLPTGQDERDADETGQSGGEQGEAAREPTSEERPVEEDDTEQVGRDLDGTGQERVEEHVAGQVGHV